MSFPRIAQTLAPALILVSTAVHAQEMVRDKVEVLEARTAATTAGQTSAELYALFVNVETNERLVGADSPLSGRVDLVAADGKKRPYEEFRFEEDSEAGFRPNEQHLRLVGLKHALLRGQSFPVTLHFQSGYALELQVIVR